MPKERILWIDWAKAICLFLVVFGHLPLKNNSLEFFASFRMPLFFILSGYLFNNNHSFARIAKTSAIALLAPYLLYSIFGYIIWLIIGYIHNTSFFSQDISELLRPVWGAILVDSKSSFASMLNTPTWFFIALFNIRIIAGLLARYNIKFTFPVFSFCCIAALYLMSKYEINLYFSIDSALMAFPFFAFGYWVKEQNLLKYLRKEYLFLFFCITLCLNIILSNLINGGAYSINGCVYGKSLILSYVNGIIGSTMIITIGLFLNKYKFKFIDTISAGAIAVVGLHGYILRNAHKIIRRILFPHEIAAFSIIEGVLISLAALLLLYYPILFFQRYFPLALGKRKTAPVEWISA